MTPNALAYAMLLVWPLISLVLFRTLGLSRGLISCLMGGYLLLPPMPAAWYVTGLPALNKEAIASLSALVICVVSTRSIRLFLPTSRVGRLLLAAYLIAPQMTILSNRDPVYWGSFVLPGMRWQDSITMTTSLVIQIAPMMLARALLSREQDQRDLLWGMVLAMLAYSIPMLVEIRLSPQLNTWIYGFFQHSFVQMVRGNGYRPIVFLYHALWVAFLTAAAVLAAVALLREGDRKSRLLVPAALWLMMMLVLCKSMASLLYVLAMLPVMLLLPARAQIRLAMIVACLVLIYPNLREAGLIPVQAAVDRAESINPERARSLEYRFHNEDVLLERALERPMFGWGNWGRNHVREADTGQLLTVSDGLWIILFGSLGQVGYNAQIGLLVLPILLIWWRGGPAPPRTVAGASVIVAINLVDLIPNATLTPLTWLFAGALLGWAERPETQAASVSARAPGLPVLLGSRSGAPIRTVL